MPRTVVNPDENFYFYWLWLITICVLYNLWTLIVRQSFPELQVMELCIFYGKLALNEHYRFLYFINLGLTNYEFTRTFLPNIWLDNFQRVSWVLEFVNLGFSNALWFLSYSFINTDVALTRMSENNVSKGKEGSIDLIWLDFILIWLSWLWAASSLKIVGVGGVVRNT